MPLRINGKTHWKEDSSEKKPNRNRAERHEKTKEMKERGAMRSTIGTDWKHQVKMGEKIFEKRDWRNITQNREEYCVAIRNGERQCVCVCKRVI